MVRRKSSRLYCFLFFLHSINIMKLEVFYLDDEVELLDLVADYLNSDKVQFTIFDNPDSFFNQIKNQTPDVVFVDHRMPGITGLEVVEKLGQVCSTKISKILVSGDLHYFPNKEFDRVFGKPFEFDAITNYLNSLHQQKRLALQSNQAA